MDPFAYIFTSDGRVIAILAKEGCSIEAAGPVPVPRERLNDVEKLLAGLPYFVAFAKDSKAARDEWDKYESGWGPDSFHTIGD